MINALEPGSADGRTCARCLIIYNPTAGSRRRRKLEAAMATLRDKGVIVELAETTGPGDPEVMAREADDSVSMVVVAGGDGTINGAVNGLMARAVG